MKESLLDLDISFKKGTIEDERVLECLQPPSNLEALEITGYGGERLPGWMVDHQLERHFPNLVEINIIDCRACKYLCSFGKLPHLKIPHLKTLDDVEYMEDNTTTTNVVDELPSSSLFPSLERLAIIGMPKLKGWWRMLLSNEQDSRGDLQVHQQHAQHQHLVEWKPPFPKLIFLEVDNVELTITTARWYSIVFTSLINLNIFYGKQSRQQQEAFSLFFPNLEDLSLQGLDELEVVPESLKGLSSLKYLQIIHCEKLKAIPEWIDTLTSLKTLQLENCPRLESLPQQIANLPNLKSLEIDRCPILKEKCQSPNGEYWPLIQHIHLLIY